MRKLLAVALAATLAAASSQGFAQSDEPRWAYQMGIGIGGGEVSFGTGSIYTTASPTGTGVSIPLGLQYRVTKRLWLEAEHATDWIAIEDEGAQPRFRSFVFGPVHETDWGKRWSSYVGLAFGSTLNNVVLNNEKTDSSRATRFKLGFRYSVSARSRIGLEGRVLRVHSAEGEIGEVKLSAINPTGVFTYQRRF